MELWREKRYNGCQYDWSLKSDQYIGFTTDFMAHDKTESLSELGLYLLL